MQKSFSKTGLSIGDKIIDMYGNRREVIDVGHNGFVYVCEYFYADDLYETFEKAIRESWTIIDDEPEEKYSFPVQDFSIKDGKKVVTRIMLDGKDIAKEAIIANNNELIEEIQKEINPSFSSLYDAAIEFGKIKIIRLIQSKNDLLSKE